jgi:hypothetical protein
MPLPKRSKFNLSHHKLLSCGMGTLVPIGCVEALPGDTFRHHTSALVRTSPLLAPVMHPVDVRIHHFFVPTRLIWKDFPDFITGGSDGNDDTEFPTITMNDSNTGDSSLADYLGVPQIDSGTGDVSVSALPFRAYNLIFNEFYRDQDLVDERALSTGNGVDTTTDISSLAKVGWEKDYFTSSRPWSQKGDDVVVPIGDTAPIVGIGKSDGNFPAGPVSVTETGGNTTSYTNAISANGASSVYFEGDASTGGELQIQADLSSATGVDVNDLRLAFAVQRMKEARAKYGSRYTEYLSYLGVNAQDKRLQRPEYLGGGKQTIQFSEVLQTAEGTDPVGDLKGHGISALRTNKYQRFVPEHGFIMSFISVRPKTMYMQNLPRMYSKRTKEEFFQKELQLVGQQIIKNREVYVNSSAAGDTFGYQDRYDEYRKVPSTISGEFKSSLNHWHMARDFASEPGLNSTFVECTPTDRIYASTSTDPLWIMCNHSMVARRLLIKNPVNKII